MSEFGRVGLMVRVAETAGDVLAAPSLGSGLAAGGIRRENMRSALQVPRGEVYPHCAY